MRQASFTMNLEKDVFAGLVTSMAFLTDSILLVGQGPWLKVFDVRHGELLAKSLVLPANRIHRLVLGKIAVVLCVSESSLHDNSTISSFERTEPGKVLNEGKNVQQRRIMAYGAKTLAILTIEHSTGSGSQPIDQSSHHANCNNQHSTKIIIKQVQKYGPFTDWIQDAQWLYEVDIVTICISHSARKVATNRRHLQPGQ